MPVREIVVIGGVAAGMSAASQIKRRLPDAHVCVFEKGHDVSYGACGMPYNVADPARDINDLVVISADQFINKRNIDLRLGHEVKRIDREKKLVRGVKEDGEKFEAPYDVLILATGSRAVTPPIPGIDSEGVFPLRTLRHADALKTFLKDKRPKNAIIIGGSYLGIEMAEAMRANGLETTIVKRSPHMLPFLCPELDEMVREELDKHQVKVIHGNRIKSIEPGEELTMKLAEGEFSAGVILTATGFAPRSELAQDAGLDLGPSNCIAVDKFGKTSDPDIYAVGDCADHFHLITGERVWVPLALHANRAGRNVGATVAGEKTEIPPIVGSSAVRAFDLETAGAGLTIGEAEKHGYKPVAETIKARTRAHAFPGARNIKVHLVADKESGRLLGGAIVGGEGAALRIDVIAAALYGEMTVETFSGMDLMYSPPFSPAWDPLLTCANQLIKKVGK